MMAHTRNPYTKWSTDALHAYLVMTQAHIQSTTSDSLREGYNTKIAEVECEIKRRQDEDSGSAPEDTPQDE
jgi:hypothetical protein